MIEIITLLLANSTGAALILVAAGLVVLWTVGALGAHRKALHSHRERMAEIGARRETAKALAAAPEEAQRNELAKQLLEAYGEAGEGLQNDEKGSLVRWESSKGND